MKADDARTIEAIREDAIALEGRGHALDSLAELVGDADVVLLGESTHGTHEFYKTRADITMRLVREHGFEAVAAEADWPDAYRVNRFVRDLDGASDPNQALERFVRFPTWMWRNADVHDLAQRLRDHNLELPANRRVGFYGLDLYSLHASIDAVLDHLDAADPDAARRARKRYSCFEFTGGDPQRYGAASRFGVDGGCEQEAVAQLVDLRRTAAERLRADGMALQDEEFSAEQNARVVQSAERYYRAMFDPRVNSWNLRDRHMDETLAALVDHLRTGGRRGKVVVWAHNSHIGDARATDMGRRGDVSIGQLARERFGHKARLVGFTTATGTVSAASDWGGDVERKRVRPPIPGSYEELFHRAEIPRFLLSLHSGDCAELLAAQRLERAIGVIYRPETERVSHYFRASLTNQFDAVLHLDHTRAVEPLELSQVWQRGEMAETFPSGL